MPPIIKPLGGGRKGACMPLARVCAPGCGVAYAGGVSLSGPVRIVVVEPVQAPQQEPAPKPQPAPA